MQFPFFIQSSSGISNFSDMFAGLSFFDNLLKIM